MEIETLIDNSEKKREYFPLTIKTRDRQHFYSICEYLNDNIGKGGEFWGCNDRPLKKITSSNGEPVELTFRVFVDGLKMPKEEFKAGQIATFLTLKSK